MSNKNNTNGDSMGGGSCGKWGGRAGRSETAKIMCVGSCMGDIRRPKNGWMWRSLGNEYCGGVEVVVEAFGYFRRVMGLFLEGFLALFDCWGGEGKGFLGFFLGVTKMANNGLEERERDGCCYLEEGEEENVKWISGGIYLSSEMVKKSNRKAEHKIIEE